MKIFNLDQIKSKISISEDFEELINSQQAAFIHFSDGLYDVPSPIQFIFPQSGSDCHIKGGYRQFSSNFVVKLASSSQLGNNGAILIFDVASCELKVILQDKGHLTTLRTAIAGVIILGLIPWKPKNIGIIGSGSLAKQLFELINVKHPQANIMFYARNKARALALCDVVCDTAEDLLIKCDVIFTTTASLQPIIRAMPEGKNKAIIGLGSDDEYKSEIAPQLFKAADSVIVDSVTQAAKFGDVARALKTDIISEDALMELGAALKSGISVNTKTIIADFSGIGAQDVAMAEFVLSRL